MQLLKYPMVLTDRQRGDLHSAIYEYLLSRDEAFQKVAELLKEADPDSCTKEPLDGGKTPLLEKKWTAIPRLQRKVLELERTAAQSAKIHAHRAGTTGTADTSGGSRRMLPRLPCTHTLQGHAAVVTCVKVHPVFTVAASGSEDGTIKVWDHESGDYIRTLKGHTHTVTDLSFTPKGSHLASSSVDLSIKLWNFSTYVCLRTLRGHDHTISGIRFLPSQMLETASGSGTTESNTTTGLDAEADGCTHLISASRDNSVKLWHVETGFCDHTFTDHTDWVRCLAVRQSDGKLWASSGNDQVIYVYDNTKARVGELRGHEHVVESLAFVTEEAFPKNNRENKHNDTVRDYLASGSRDRSVRLWKVSSGECLAVFSSHENWVRGVIIHPNGKYVVSCGDDRTIRVFDIQAKRCLRTLEHAHDHFVTSIDQHHTLPILVSGGVDQKVRCWMLD